MTNEQATDLVKALHAKLGDTTTRGLNAAGHGGLKVGTELVSFQYIASRGVLIARSHLYTFRHAPAPNAVERAKAAFEGKSKLGTVVYDADAKLLSLATEYAAPVSAEVFLADVKALATASLTFTDLL